MVFITHITQATLMLSEVTVAPLVIFTLMRSEVIVMQQCSNNDIFPLLRSNVFQQWDPRSCRLLTSVEKRDRQTDTDEPIRFSSLMQEREEHLKNFLIFRP
jgi:hypothetical protein